MNEEQFYAAVATARAKYGAGPLRATINQRTLQSMCPGAEAMIPASGTLAEEIAHGVVSWTIDPTMADDTVVLLPVTDEAF